MFSEGTSSDGGICCLLCGCAGEIWGFGGVQATCLRELPD